MNDPQVEVLRRHHSLEHAPFQIIRLLVVVNILPRHLLNAKILKCPSCQYGAMNRCPFRGKNKPNKIKLTVVHRPGDYVSVDKMESFILGFMA